MHDQSLEEESGQFETATLVVIPSELASVVTRLGGYHSSSMIELVAVS